MRARCLNSSLTLLGVSVVLLRRLRDVHSLGIGEQPLRAVVDGRMDGVPGTDEECVLQSMRYLSPSAAVCCP